jgi:RNA polymerase sigma-70 factor (ECF subfamily)
LNVYRDVRVQAATTHSREILYERAYQAHWTPVFRFTLAWTNDWAAAEDIAQDAFLRLWRNRDRIDWSQDVLPWLLVASRRLATDRFRSLRRRILPPPGPATLDDSARIRWLDLQAALKGLSSLERAATILTLQGASSHEAAALLGTTAGSVRAAVGRAREKLQEEP